jgi:glycosyltransferase involved in cell wall biosynthesis
VTAQEQGASGSPPAVSVVITCYNLEAYIGAAIQSALDQDWGQPYEIVAVDDCSTDASADIIRRFPDVRYVRTPQNSGVLLATIAGIEAAKADVVLFLDGDDLWEADKLRHVAAAFAADPGLALVTHDLTYIDANGAPVDLPSRPARRLGAVAEGARGEAVRNGILELSDYVWLGSALAVSRANGDVDGFCRWARALPDPRNTYQDWPLAYWIAARRRARLAYLPQRLFRYRLHGANHSGDARTAERAARNFNRSLRTTAAMVEIANRSGLSPRLRGMLRRQARFNAYLVSLHSGRRFAAVRGFAASLPYLLRHPRLAPKEAVRFLAVQCLGPRRFAAIAARR